MSKQTAAVTQPNTCKYEYIPQPHIHSCCCSKLMRRTPRTNLILEDEFSSTFPVYNKQKHAKKNNLYLDKQSHTLGRPYKGARGVFSLGSSKNMCKTTL